MNVQGPHQSAIGIRDQYLIDSVGFHQVYGFYCQLFRMYSTRMLVHQFTNRCARKIFALLNQTTQVTIRENTYYAKRIVDHGRHRHAFAGDFKQRFWQAHFRAYGWNVVAGAHDISDMGEQASAERAARVGPGKILFPETASV
jgi:hypothetical protein